MTDHQWWCGDPSLSRPDDRCTCNITPEQQRADNTFRDMVALTEELGLYDDQGSRELLITPAAGSEFPPRNQVNWELLKKLYGRPHPLLHDIDTSGLHYGVAEVLLEAKAVHHLLDLAGVPHGYSLDTRTIDSRTLLAIMALGTLRERLARISGWHARDTGPAGTVGDLCIECGHRWPCDTRRMTDGTYRNEDDDE